jgi:predicted  nucleic acid-binding Zn-ribbon protein
LLFCIAFRYEIRVGQLEQDLQTLQSDKHKLEKDLTSSRKKVEQLQADRSSGKKKQEEKIQAQKEYIAELCQREEQLSKANLDLTQRYSALQERLEQ